MKKKVGGSSDEARERKDVRFNGSDSQKNTKMRRNMQRLGGRGLSLQAFANAKSGTNNYNPSLIKKQREFYKNAKFVGKYKRTLKQQEHHRTDLPLATRLLEDQNETEEVAEVNHKTKKNKNKNARSAKELYEMKREEEEKARIERETIIQVKDEERRKTEARRKALRGRMLKKTKSGQPVMKYRIEHLLETIQGSTR